MTVVNSATTGIKKLVYAIMTDELLEAYGPVKEAPPVINIKVAPKVDIATLYADNRAVETAASIGDIPVEFETQDLPYEVQADFLGHALDPITGILTKNTADKSPYPVSYTHLRAHETRHDLVCRLLLEKKKKKKTNKKYR